MVLLQDGTTYIWGSNANYKLTTTQETNQVLPKQNKQINALAIEAGVENGAYIDNEGFLNAWGLGTYGTIENKNGNPAEFVSAGFPFSFIYYCDLTSFQSAL